MKMQLLLTSILAFGMGLAQAQTPAPMQSGTQEPSRNTGQTPSGMPDRGTGGAAIGAPGSETAVAPQTFKGCLTGSSGNWTLAADNGQTLKVSGVDNQLSSFNNQQVNINGTQATDGTLKVVSIDKISDSCSNTGQAATSSSISNQPSSSTNQGNMSGSSTSSAASQPPSSTENTSTTNTQSATSSTTTSGTNQTANTGAVGQSTTSPSSTTPPASTADQNAASSSSMNNTATSTQGNAGSTSPTASNNDQNAGVGASGAASNQNAGQGATATTGQTSEQPVRHISDMDENQKAIGGQQLPQTASPLPLLGLLGLGSLVIGLVARRKK